MPVIEANGEQLFYVAEGEGPAILFIHGLGANSYYWRGQMAALKDRYTCISVDLRGHGESSYNGTFNVPDVAADLKSLLEGLDIERCHLVALAMGGPIAMELNARWPGTARSMVIACSFVDKREGVEERYRATVAALERVTMLEFGRRYADERLMPATPQQAFDELADAVAKLSTEAYLDTVRAVLMEDFSALPATVGVAALVLLGDKDTVTPLPHSKAIADGIAGASFEMIPDAGHLANLDQPELFNALIAAFLDSQTG